MIKNQQKFLRKSFRYLFSEKNTQQEIKIQENNIDHSKETDFGYKKVKLEEKQSLVNEVFSNVASKYDIMNDFMSMGIHRLWKQYLVDDIGILKPKYIYENNEIIGKEPVKILDVASGTGDISYQIIQKQMKNCQNLNLLHEDLQVTLSDVNQDILKEAKLKLSQLQIDPKIVNFLVSSAESFENIPDNTYDLYVISFGLRNVPDIPKALKEAYRVLKPGGRFLCMEFSKVQNEILNQVYKQYSFNIIPFMGQLVANDRDSYQYLVESIEKFYDQESLLELIEKTGFKYSNYENYSQGIVAVHSGFKIQENFNVDKQQKLITQNFINQIFKIFFQFQINFFYQITKFVNIIFF